MIVQGQSTQVYQHWSIQALLARPPPYRQTLDAPWSLRRGFVGSLLTWLPQDPTSALVMGVYPSSRLEDIRMAGDSLSKPRIVGENHCI